MRMKTIVSSMCLFLVLLPFLSATATPTGPGDFSPVQKGLVAAGQKVLPYAPDRIMIKFRETSLDKSTMKIALQRGSAVPAALTGLGSVDDLGREFKVKKISRPYIELNDKIEADRLGIDRFFMIEMEPGSDVMEAVAKYAADPNVEHAQPDWAAFPMVVPTDPLYPNHWGHNNTAQLPGYDWGGTWSHTGPPVGTVGFDANAQAAWNASQGFGSATVIIAIIDSGVDLDHPDLTLVTGYDYGDNDANPDDNSASPGHGTACAGVAAAKANNGIGACGIAAGCKVMPLKVANSAGSMYFSAIQNALYYAANNGARIISMSLGAAISSDPATDTAILYAYNAGCVILAATGNENKSTISYPAINTYVIGVGAASPCGDRKRSSSLSSECNPGVYTDPRGYTCDGERWWGSNYGSTTKDAAGAVDILAPTILATTDIAGSGGYTSGDYNLFFNGTSCSTPYAAGVCALIKSKNPTWTPAQIRAQLTSTAIDIVNVEAVSGWDRYSGYGMVNAEAAVGGSSPTIPVAAFVGVPTSGTVPLTVVFTDQSTGSPTSWSWAFGDGGTSTLQNPSRTYTVAGSYTVMLTATNASGSDGETKTNYITVNPPGGTWTTITFDNFETGMGTYTDGGADMSRYTGTTYAHQGAAAADIQDNSGVASSFYHTAGYNVSAYTDLEVEFWFRAVSMESGEDFWVQYFDGSTWRTVATYVSGTGFSNNVFYSKIVKIPKGTYAYPTNAKLRFMCDASNDADDVYIDEITFRGLSGGVASSSGGTPESEPRIEDERLAAPGIPRIFGLDQNYPNPFNPVTTIKFNLADAGHARLDIFDASGRLVKTLVNEAMAAGPHEVTWNASGIASGIYFSRLRQGDITMTKKMILLR